MYKDAIRPGDKVSPLDDGFLPGACRKLMKIKNYRPVACWRQVGAKYARRDW
jgi:hypothetical protein